MPHQLDSHDPYDSKHIPKLFVQSDREAEMKGQSIGIISEILNIFDGIQSLQDLRPRPEVNDLFGRLVELCIQPRTEAISRIVLEDQNIKLITPKLRKLCSAAEGELETYWAHRILESALESNNDTDTAWSTLQTFPYYTNYISLTRLETSALSSVLLDSPRAIAFIGSGPLPLTSFCFADHYPNAEICNIDREPQALQLSSSLAKTLGYERMIFRCENAAHCTNLAAFDVVFLAALVGMDKTEKEVVLRGIVARMKKGAVLCVRSAHSLRGLLYPIVEFEEDFMDMGLQLEVVVHPWNYVVNSLMVFRLLRTMC